MSTVLISIRLRWCRPDRTERLMAVAGVSYAHPGSLPAVRQIESSTRVFGRETAPDASAGRSSGSRLKIQ